jgi:type IV pilus assembly protein PilC
LAIFRYEAADVNGKILRGAMDASSREEVARRLEGRGYRAVQVISPAAATTTATPRAAAPPGSTRAVVSAAAPEDLGVFFRQMASLLGAGFTPAAALADLAPRTRRRSIATAARAMAAATANGSALSREMAHHPGLFAPNVVGLVAAGETGGFLPFACEEAALHAEQDAALRQGLWLPKFLIWQSVWSVPLTLPLFPTFFSHPSMAGLRAYASATLRLALPAGIALHLLAALAGRLWRQPFAADIKDRLSLALPVTRRLARARGLAAFTRVLRRLLLAGISPEPAFTAAARAVPNGVLRDRLLGGVEVLRAGRGLDAAIERTGLMEHDPVQLLVTGQRTGQWTEMLDQVTGYYQEEAARATDAAKSAQKRLGVLVTLIATGYVTIALTYGSMHMAFKFTEGWEQ